MNDNYFIIFKDLFHYRLVLKKVKAFCNRFYITIAIELKTLIKNIFFYKIQIY
jgi:hypothetical protein